jgi:hypothetical protein
MHGGERMESRAERHERQRRYRARKKRAGYVWIETYIPGTWVVHMRERMTPATYNEMGAKRTVRSEAERMIWEGKHNYETPG